MKYTLENTKLIINKNRNSSSCRLCIFSDETAQCNNEEAILKCMSFDDTSFTDESSYFIFSILKTLKKL